MQITSLVRDDQTLCRYTPAAIAVRVQEQMRDLHEIDHMYVSNVIVIPQKGPILMGGKQDILGGVKDVIFCFDLAGEGEPHFDKRWHTFLLMDDEVNMSNYRQSEIMLALSRKIDILTSEGWVYRFSVPIPDNTGSFGLGNILLCVLGNQ